MAVGSVNNNKKPPRLRKSKRGCARVCKHRRGKQRPAALLLRTCFKFSWLKNVGDLPEGVGYLRKVLPAHALLQVLLLLNGLAELPLQVPRRRPLKSNHELVPLNERVQVLSRVGGGRFQPLAAYTFEKRTKMVSYSLVLRFYRLRSLFVSER